MLDNDIILQIAKEKGLDPDKFKQNLIKNKTIIEYGRLLAKKDENKVVEAARAYVECVDSYLRDHSEKALDIEEYVALLEEYAALKEALNSTPPRPSKEECIDWLATYFQIGDVTQDFATKVTATIEYLKEPSFTRIKNTGVKPEYKAVTIFCRNGSVESFLATEQSLVWELDGSDFDIIEYIILY